MPLRTHCMQSATNVHVEVVRDIVVSNVKDLVASDVRSIEHDRAKRCIRSVCVGNSLLDLRIIAHIARQRSANINPGSAEFSGHSCKAFCRPGSKHHAPTFLAILGSHCLANAGPRTQNQDGLRPSIRACSCNVALGACINVTMLHTSRVINFGSAAYAVRRTGGIRRRTVRTLSAVPVFDTKRKWMRNYGRIAKRTCRHFFSSWERIGNHFERKAAGFQCSCCLFARASR